MYIVRPLIGIFVLSSRLVTPECFVGSPQRGSLNRHTERKTGRRVINEDTARERGKESEGEREGMKWKWENGRRESGSGRQRERVGRPGKRERAR